MFKRIKKIIIPILIMLSFLSCTLADDELEELDYDLNEVLETSAKAMDEPKIDSKYAVAYDRSSKTVIWGKEENKEVPMASTTKIMTSIILLEHGKDSLNDEVEVCKQAGSIGGSRLGLKTGDKIILNDLFYGLMLRSGNDAAIQIATSIGGSTENFVKMMNEKAKELGLEHTHFTSPHGLDNEEHYTTATELAIMTDYAMQFEEFRKAVGTKNCNVKINGYYKNITNTNELLGVLDGVNGVKTGFTNKAGRCLVTSISRNNFDIIVVVLGADTKKIRTRDSIRIIEYIYENYELVNLKNLVLNEYEKWKAINEKRIIVNKGRTNAETECGDIKYETYPINKNDIVNITIYIEGKTHFEAPLNGKEKIGEIKVCVRENKIQEIDIINKKTVNKKNIWMYMNEILNEILKDDLVHIKRLEL